MAQSIVKKKQTKKTTTSHYSQILVTSVLDPVSSTKYQIKEHIYEGNLSFYIKHIYFGQLCYQNSSFWQTAGATSLTSNLSSRVTELACQHLYHLTGISYNINQAIKEVTT